MCYPLTVTDGHSRRILCCDSISRSARSFGCSIGNENGGCFKITVCPMAHAERQVAHFATHLVTGRPTSLNVWWLKLGSVLHGRTHEQILAARRDQPCCRHKTCEQQQARSWPLGEGHQRFESAARGPTAVMSRSNDPGVAGPRIPAATCETRRWAATDGSEDGGGVSQRARWRRTGGADPQWPGDGNRNAERRHTTNAVEEMKHDRGNRT